MNYYEILGVNENASKEEIKKAYKNQMKKWHPDINKSNDAINMSTKINEAKEVLLDDVKRMDYDNSLKNKIKEDYNKYTQKKNNSTNVKNTNYKEEEKVTKWQYLNEWLKYSNVSSLRKLLGVIGVLLESFLCFIIKSLLIIISFIFYFLSDFIRTLYYNIYPIIGIIFMLFLFICMSNGWSKAIEENHSIFIGLLIIIGVYISSFILPLLGNLILSEKTFNILYNKIDINLFKKCVGIK